VTASNKKAKKMADIALLAGVSTSTASRALQDSSLISAETKERVQAIARKHNYQSNLLARNLRLSQSNSIALVLPIDPATEEIWSNPFVLKFIGAVGSVLSKHGYDVLVSQANFNESQFDRRYYNSGLVGGFILLGRSKDDTNLNAMAANGVPLVVWGPMLPRQQYCSVGIDNIASAREATHHMIKLGRRRIAIIAGDLENKRLEGSLRYQGYAEALGAAGISVDPALVTTASFSGESGYAAMKSLLQTSPDLDAVFVAYSDTVAIAAMKALGDSGKRVPEDISLVGFDNIDVSAFTNPPLTTVAQGLRRGGGAELLVQKLLQQISGEKATSAMIDGELIVRQSCGVQIFSRR
jgi:DNA-binding LacI/PurR family transcriptional regulator